VVTLCFKLCSIPLELLFVGTVCSEDLFIHINRLDYVRYLIHLYQTLTFHQNKETIELLTNLYIGLGTI